MQAVNETVQPRLVGVDTAARSLGVGRTVVFDLIRSGELRSLQIGRRRLVEVAAIDEFVARQREAQAV